MEEEKFEHWWKVIGAKDMWPAVSFEGHSIINSEDIHYCRASANERIWYSWECQYLSIDTSFIEIQMHT